MNTSLFNTHTPTHLHTSKCIRGLKGRVKPIKLLEENVENILNFGYEKT